MKERERIGKENSEDHEVLSQSTPTMNYFCILLWRVGSTFMKKTPARMSPIPDRVTALKWLSYPR